jgi:hypothetical protein
MFEAGRQGGSFEQKVAKGAKIFLRQGGRRVGRPRPFFAKATKGTPYRRGRGGCGVGETALPHGRGGERGQVPAPPKEGSAGEAGGGPDGPAAAVVGVAGRGVFGGTGLSDEFEGFYAVDVDGDFLCFWAFEFVGG